MDKGSVAIQYLHTGLADTAINSITSTHGP